MNPSKVYFTNFRAHYECNLLQKLQLLLTEAGLERIDFNKKFAAIKLHFGEPGNLSYLRPNYAKAVADYIRQLGGAPFLTDSNTLYVGRRKNALDHLEAAYENGFNPFQTGCQVIIADGLKGTNVTHVPIQGEYVKRAKIGDAIMDADIFISLTHFKGHESTGFGGALKNIGMGAGSRAGKMEMHSAGKPQVDKEICVSCGSCARNCAHGAIIFDTNKKAGIDHDKCVGCGRCIGMCNVDAIQSASDESNIILNKKIAEYTWAVIKDRPHFHISLVMDVSPLCDCVKSNDAPIVPNVGMFASFDPIALDQACADAVNRQPVNPNSYLSEQKQHGDDHFHRMHPDTNWESCLEHGEKIGIGQRSYDLIEVMLPELSCQPDDA